MGIHNNSLTGASGQQGYQISRSVRLRNSATGYFSRTNSSSPTNAKKGTFSLWVKRGAISAATGNSQYLIESGTGTSNDTHFTMFFQTNDTLSLGQYSWAGYSSTQVFRDPSAWYHILLSYDSTLASNNLTLYINGQQLAVTSVTQNTNWAILNASQAINIGRHTSVGRTFDGYLTEVNLIDGQALTPSSFGETNAITGVWQPKKYGGTYGTNGFYLNFSDNSSVTTSSNVGIGKDFSGNGNYWTSNSISVSAGVTYDSMLDVPTPYADGGNGRGNYAVLNPISMAGSTATLSKGNLSFTNSGTHARRASSISMSSGKWYAEATITTVGGSYPTVGIATTSTFNGATYVGADSTSYGYSTNATKYNNAVAVSYGATYTTNDVIGIALDLDAGTLVFYKNNVSQGTAYSSLSGEFTFAVSGLTGTVWELNFGQRPFTYTPPTGFVALNTQNLPTPTISNGANYMAATLYTGTGATQTINNLANGVSFQPDWVWTKCRSFGFNNNLTDSVRGIDKKLISNTTDAEITIATFSSFNTNGFTLSNTNVERQNDSGQTYVAWQWNAGGSTVTNTSGTISAQVRANATAGFSVVTYTGNGTGGATVGHGLGVAPRMVIVKPRLIADNWNVYHASNTSDPATDVLYLNLTNATSDNNTIWNDTAPTSTVFTIGSNSGINTNTSTYVAYCFAAVAGYSAFGSYTGNNSTDGPFVYLGFRPRWVMIKSASVSPTDWLIYDTSRNTYNVMNSFLQSNTASAEGTYALLDALSNGFKIRNTGANGSGETVIYAAFAENPFKLSLAR